MPEVWNAEVAQEVVRNLDKDVGCVLVAMDYNISYLKIFKAVNYFY